MYLYCKVSRKTLLIASVLVSRPSPHRTHPAIPRGRSIRPLLQFVPFLLCSAKPTEHLLICVMVSRAPPTMVSSDADWGAQARAPRVAVAIADKSLWWLGGVGNKALPMESTGTASLECLKHRALGFLRVCY